MKDKVSLLQHKAVLHLIIGTTYNDQTGLYGFSVQSVPYKAIEELAASGRFRNPKISVSTVSKLRILGEIQLIFPGGIRVISTPSTYSLYHCDVSISTPMTELQSLLISAQFFVIRNPAQVQ